MSKIIDIRDVEFAYPGGATLLSKFNLSIENNTTNAIIAENGAGKTTLLNLITGLLFPLYGKIEVLGYNPQQRKPGMLQDIYYLPEEIFNTDLDIAKFEKIYAPFYPNYSSSRFFSNLNDFSVDHKISKISNYSDRQRKKFMIAFGLATKARIILLDEPTKGLDKPSKKQFCRMLSASKSKKGCIIITNQQPADLDDSIDNVVIMENHNIIFHQTTTNILKKIQFITSHEKEISANIIHSEVSHEGYCQLITNNNEQQSIPNFEVLVNALRINSEKINLLF